MSIWIKWLAAVLALCFQTGLLAQSIDRIEYFIDQDPGLGNGIALPISASPTISNTFNLTFSSLANGVHHLFFRARDTSGNWSHTHHRPFFFLNAVSPPNPTITEIEYFFDQDPGLGNGTQVTFSASQSVDITFPVDLSGLSVGVHSFHIRSNSQNGWSLLDTRLIFVNPTNMTNVDEVVEIEYYFDIDPGYGNGFPISISSPDTSLDLAANIDISSLPVGLHQLNIRSKGGNGRWSLTESRPFLKGPFSNFSSPQLIEAVEYFIDSDPGYGNGNSIPIVPDTTLEIPINVDLTGLLPGLHHLHIRARNSTGFWSVVQDASFMLWPGDTSFSQIVEVEYFIDNDPGYGNGIPIPMDSNVAIDTVVNIDTSGLSVDTHRVFIRVLDNLGRWSLTESFSICYPGIPEAGFELIAAGMVRSFSDSSKRAASYLYDFGDGFSDTVSYPLHLYAPGSYSAMQIVENFCGSDTSIILFDVAGIESYSPKQGGNAGDVLIDIYGGGFDSTSTVILKRFGYSDITPIKLIHISSDRFAAQFDLRGQAIGDWDIEINISGTSPFLFQQGFEIVDGSYPSAWANIIGPSTVRPGRWNRYKVQFGNNTSNDARGVPLWLAIPQNSDVEFDFDIRSPQANNIDFDTIQTFIPVDSIYGQPFQANVYWLYLPYVRANTSNELTFKVRFSNPGQNQLAAWTHPPVFNSPFNIYSSKCLELNYEKLLEEILGQAQDEGEACIYGALDLALSSFSDLYLENTEIDQAWLGSFSYSMAKVIVSCGSVLSPHARGWKIGKKLLEYTDKVIEYYDQGQKLAHILCCISNCRPDSLPPQDSLRPPPAPPVFFMPHPVNALNSFDPNDKVGPLGPDTSSFVNRDHFFEYLIRFENVDSATAPAQIIKITDTIDSSVFDLGTFRINSFSIADSTYLVPPGRKEWTQDVPFESNPAIFVRFNSWLDTSGIFNSEFIALDTSTNEITNDPFAGVLPPNQTPPEGEGSISFSIRQRDSLPHLSLFHNRASIVFDYNLPIITNKWINTLDTISPITMMDSLAPMQYDSLIPLSWSVTDQGAGAAYFNLYKSTNGGDFELLAYFVRDTIYEFDAEKDSIYSFYCIGVDSVRNQESKNNIGEVYFQYIDTCIYIRTSLDTVICFGDSIFGYSAPGQYIDSFPSPNACDSIRTLILQASSPLPTPNILQIGPDTLRCDVTAWSYEWWFNGTLLPSQSQSLYAVQTGVYTVRILDSLGCTSSASSGFSFVYTKGVNFGERVKNITIVPNPTSGLVRVLGPHHDYSNISIQIVSAWGQQVFSEEFSDPDSDEFRIDLSNLPKGLYWLWYVADGESVVSKVAVK